MQSIKIDVAPYEAALANLDQLLESGSLEEKQELVRTYDRPLFRKPKSSTLLITN
jgi:hypothetical protein